ncbi:MAG: hypothetical protein Q8R69_23275 [Telluria sp.]|nr:hypothetical protein [Telluria sp.]
MNEKAVCDARSLAQRRAALIAQCAAQRTQARDQLAALVKPGGAGGLLRFLPRGKLALGAAGVVLGLLVTKPGSLATAGLSLWKLVRSALRRT